MKLPPVFLHWRWSWLFYRHLEQCWLNILIGIIRAFLLGQSSFALSFSVTILILWFPCDLGLLNEGDRIWNEPCQHAFSRLKDEKDVIEEKERRGEKRGRRNTGRTEIERSNFSDHTNYRNIQEPVSAESISSHSPISSPLFPLLTVSFLSLVPISFFFSILSYNPSGITIGRGTSCREFSFSVWVLSITTPGELWAGTGAIEVSLQPFCGQNAAVFK